MIKGIGPSGKYITTSGGGGATSTYVNNYGSAMGTGNMRYNTSSQNIEVWDGSNWIMLNMGYASVGLTDEAESLLDWAKQKRAEEFEINELAKSNATLADAVAVLKQAQEQVKILAALVKE